ncbi:TetR family transcriptional regulator [Actinoallomurus purpureus]|uniref:TetR/AcrR family transcriptional regulator n=1 Tax=Actinoallomurus purpureus TaxID=478114 RepID=UPI0020921373|nr:TetR family transcriptional regulator [Actinoallomurus purpureus]MCO6008848.1 TetR family transcriptional regulator [Actinoallomurus purpureus]
MRPGRRLKTLGGRAGDPVAGPGAGRPEPAQARGRQRKEALLDAAVDLLETGGFTQVTHRAVADRAALPLAATTYYFRSLEDLLAQAFARLVERDVAAMRGRVRPVADPEPVAVADAVVSALAPGDEAERSRQLALWELYFQVGREPALRSFARAWTDGCHKIVAEVLEKCGHPHSPVDVDILVATIEGMIARDLVEARPGAIQTMVDTVARLLPALRVMASRESASREPASPESASPGSASPGSASPGSASRPVPVESSRP